ncbi:MAG TPA: hypothetical protein VF720_09780, partial [Candidatus Eisenbacteria bacterium]
MRSIAARTGVSSLVILVTLSGPPAAGVTLAAEPVGAPSNMRHGPLTAAVARRDSLTAPDIDALVTRALAGSPDLAALEARAEGARRAA